MKDEAVSQAWIKYGDCISRATVEKKHEKPAVDGEKLLSSHSIYFRDFPGLHLQVAFCLSVKTSLRAKLFIWKFSQYKFIFVQIKLIFKS